MNLAHFLAFSCLTACGGVMFANRAEQFKDPKWGALKRAAFELECKVEQLQLEALGDDVGVSGCGKRAVYKYNTLDGWVNNTGFETPGAAK